MADNEEITNQIEVPSRPQDDEKSPKLEASENAEQNMTSMALQGAKLPSPQLQVQPQQLPPQQQQQPQVLSSAQINASISGNASPQLFQIQQQPGQTPQTMALINGRLVPVSATPLNVPDSGIAPNPVTLPQVQVRVQGQQTAVDMQGSIAQKQSTVENSLTASTQEKFNSPDSKVEKAEIISNAPPPTSTQSQTRPSANPTAQKSRDRGCGCGFWAAIMRPFQQTSQPQRNDTDNKDKRDNNENTAANNDNQDNTTASQSLGTTAVNMAVQAINPGPALAPAAQGDPSQTSRDMTADDVGQNTTATYYPLGTNDSNTVHAMNNQAIYTGPTSMMIPDTGQYSVPVQQPSNVVDSSQAVPTPDQRQAPNQDAADGTNVDNGGVDEAEEEDVVDEEYEDDADNMEF